nr:low-density lipoprotein receptor-related protein 5-like [Dermatophagoides farinae]
MDTPRTIVLVPSEGFMFWSDWGQEPKIEKISMDGDESTRVIVINKDIYWPNALTVDYESKRLYFGDAKYGYIASCDFDGKNLKKIVSNVSNIFALTMNNNMLYWTEVSNDMQNNRIHRNGLYYFDMDTGIVSTPNLNPELRLSPIGITVFSSSRQPKSFNPCDRNNGGCSHLCLLSSANPSHYSCACPTGVILKSDNRTCHSNAQKFLLLARRFDIRIISLDTADYTPVVLPIRNMKNTITLDYDPVEGKVYWTDDDLRTIKWSTLNGSHQETIISSEIMHTDGLAIDWVARNIYWTDTTIDRIEVARLDGSFRKILINENIDQPRAIAVHPYEGLMFWTDWGQTPKVERASLDGSDRIAIINSSLTWPNGLAIDFELSHIYWCDAKEKTIEMARFDGSDRKTIASFDRSHMFGFSMIDEWIYWTDWTLRTIERVHKMTGHGHSIIIENLPDLMGLKAVGKQFTETNACSAPHNGNCSHFCFNRPHQRFVCACSDGFELNEDGQTCSKSELYFFVLRHNDTTKISFREKKKIPLPINDMHWASSFDVDIGGNHIYWTHNRNRIIYRSLINGSKSEAIVQTGLGSPVNLAIDWISENLYWVDVEFRRIEVAKSNGFFRRILFYDRSRQPNSLVVDPIDSHLFWSDWSNNGRIVSSFLDGNKRKNIVDSVGRATGLTIDFYAKRLFWISLDKIMSSYYNGTGRSSITLDFTVPIKPISMAIDENFVYFLSPDSKTLEFVNKSHEEYFQQNIWLKDDLFSAANHLSIYDVSIHKGWNMCSDKNNKCEHLCFIKTKTTQKHRHQDPYCSCASHYTLDTHDFKRCLPPEKFLLFSQKNLIMRFLFDPKTTTSGDFQDIILPIHNLKNVRTLAFDQFDHFVYWIDGKSIKRTNASGLYPIETLLYPHQSVQPIDLVIDPYARILFWTCNITNSINATRIIGKPIMVGTVHHNPATQDRPRLLAYHQRTNILFWTNNIAYPQIRRISFIPSMKKTTVIKDLRFEVTAIAVDQELDILIWFVSLMNQIECSNLEGYSRQVLYSEDNLYPIAMAAYDRYLFWIERDKKSVMKLPLDLNEGKNKQTIFIKDHTLTDIIAVPQMSKYSSDLFCSRENGGCSHFCFVSNYSSSFNCTCPQGLMLSDGETARDCIDVIECKTGEYQCHTGKCIPGSLRCNGISECPDTSDEMDCPICATNQTICYNHDNLFCLEKRQLCDGINDCAGGFDEICCNHEYEFRCNSNNCITKQQLCDGKQDCLDGEDEHSDRCHDLANNMNNIGNKISTSNPIPNLRFIFLIVIFAIIVFIYSYYQCRRYNHSNHNDDKDVGNGVNDMLMTERYSLPGSTTTTDRGNIIINNNNRNPHKKHQLNGFINTTNNNLNGTVGKLDCNTMTTTTTTISNGMDTLPTEHLNNILGGVGSSNMNNNMTSMNPSSSIILTQTESLIERNVTGASSTSSSANIAAYAQQAINPPPSPATQRSQCSTLSSSLFVARPRQGRNIKNNMFANSSGSKNRKKTNKNKNKWNNKLSNRGPPPTPCSTDVYEDIEPSTIKYVYYDNNQTEMDDEYDYKPPPPTPRYFSDPSCPPSPVTERSYCNPYPPPPSPVQDYE